MIELRGVHFQYLDGFPVLAEAELCLGPGLTLLVGPNGCGKSTLLKLMAGVEPPDAGRVAVLGHDLWKGEVAARRALAYLPEHPDLTPYASLLEVMQLVASLRGESPRRAAAVLGEVGLAERPHASVRELSAGQRRRALLAAAWIGSPRVALLDEPLEALDRELCDRVLGWIDGLARGGATVVVVSHQLEAFASFATGALSVRAGRIVGPIALEGDPAARLVLLDRLARGDVDRLACG